MTYQSALYSYDYTMILSASQSVDWRIDDVIGPDARLDFTRPFLPEALARTADLTFLDTRERILLNQIRGHGYLAMFGLIEEFILPFVLDQVRRNLGHPGHVHDDARVRALLQFAAEEAKHIDLFKRFRGAFENGFGTPCTSIGPPQAVAEAVLRHSTLAVGLVILHFEWMTQSHYRDTVQDENRLEPLFKSLLYHHWLEEAQHAKLDTLLIEAMALGTPRAVVDEGVDGYLAIIRFLDQGLMQQAVYDLETFEDAAGRTLAEGDRERFLAQQHQAMRWSFLGYGMQHPNLLATLDRIAPGARTRIEDVAPTYC